MNNSHRGVLAYHVIFGTYGFWLPNDPRGSWSDFVRTWEIFLAGGPATKTDARHSVAAKAHDIGARLAAKKALRFPQVVFNGHQALAVARGFARKTAKSGYHIHACSILPQHVHMVIGRHNYYVESIVNLLKGAASRELANTGLHPLGRWREKDGTIPTPWVRNCWKVFLDDEERIQRAIRYVEDNPVKEGKRPQRWRFVVPFSGGPFRTALDVNAGLERGPADRR